MSAHERYDECSCMFTLQNQAYVGWYAGYSTVNLERLLELECCNHDDNLQVSLVCSKQFDDRTYTSNCSRTTEAR